MRPPRCTSCGKEFATARGAFMHWRSSHSRFKLRGDGERAVLEALADSRRHERVAEQP